MKALVTGGCGFIGSHVVDELLQRNYDVLILDNFFSGRDHWGASQIKPTIRRVDIRDRDATMDAIREFAPEVTFHLAAHHYIPFCDQHPIEAYELNVVGTLNILGGSWKAGVKRFFFASTADVYAPSPRAHREEDATGPFTVYGRTKLLGEGLCKGATDWGWDVNLLIGRLFNAVGTRETNPHLVPDIVRQVSDGADMLSLGNLHPTRDFVDVDTQAKAIVDAALAVTGIEICNIGSGVAVRVEDIVKTIILASGRSIQMVSDPKKQRAAERNNLCADVRRLTRLIGYAPQPASQSTIAAILSELKGTTGTNPELQKVGLPKQEARASG